MRSRWPTLASGLVLLAVATACDDEAPNFHVVCEEDVDCRGGLACGVLYDDVGSGGACIPAGRFCTRTCTTDADCESLGGVCDMPCRSPRYCR